MIRCKSFAWLCALGVAISLSTASGSTLASDSTDAGTVLDRQQVSYSEPPRLAFVPEPASIALLLIGGLLILARRREDA